MTRRDVRRTYLELRSPAELRPVPTPGDPPELTREAPCSVALSRALYREVGRDYHWRDRDALSDAELEAYLSRPEVEVHVMRREGNPLGFFELMRHDDGSAEIVLFGLMPAAQGQGLGKWLLTRAVGEAWGLGATRVWLHTCTLDSPRALPNYLARGFVPYRSEIYTVNMADADGGVSVRGGASG
jgi:GNAT superfamily N-acetyltransferase